VAAVALGELIAWAKFQPLRLVLDRSAIVKTREAIERLEARDEI
jgi:hypothetical protein